MKQSDILSLLFVSLLVYVLHARVNTQEKMVVKNTEADSM